MTAKTKVNKGGRPASYRTEFCDQARKLCQLGATDPELADFFSVSVQTILNWRNRYPDFAAAVKVGKAAPDERVERSLYQRAVGYNYESEKVFSYQGQIVRAKTLEHVPADTTAMIFWLKNRCHDVWRDRHDHEHTGKNGEALEVTINPIDDARQIAFALAKAANALKDLETKH